MINLASRPFRNERLPATLIGVAAVVLVLLTVVHAVAASRLARSPARGDLLKREAELAELRREIEEAERVPPPDRVAAARWAVLKELADRRMFSWTRLFHQLESALPREVRLLSLAPEFDEGEVSIAMDAVANPPAKGLEVIDVLEADAFGDVYPLSVSQRDDGSAVYQYELRYEEPAMMVEGAGRTLPGAASAATKEAAEDVKGEAAEEPVEPVEEPAEEPEADLAPRTPGPRAQPATPGPRPPLRGPSPSGEVQ